MRRLVLPGLLLAALLAGCTFGSQPTSVRTPAGPTGGTTTTAASLAATSTAPSLIPNGGAATPTAVASAAAAPTAATVTSIVTAAPTGSTASSAPTPVPAPATPAPSPTRVDAINSAFNILMDLYYRPLSSSTLLQSAWTGVADMAHGQVASADLRTPAFNGNRQHDVQLFDTRYTTLIQANSGLDPVQVSFSAVSAMAASLHDDHTAFLSPAVNARFQQGSSGGTRTTGIGIVIGSQGPPYTVETVVAGAPAQKAGVKAGDQIMSVNNVDVSHDDLQQLTMLLRGPLGTQVQLGLRRPGGGDVVVTITRAQFVAPVLESSILPGGIGVLRLSQFPETFVTWPDGKTFEQEVDADLASFEKAGVKAWVIDLRNDPGGSVGALSEFAGRFLPDGLVVVSVGRGKDVEETPVDGHLFTVQRPLAVLINGGSASSSELFAAAMQQYGRAKIVGERSAGAVNASEEFPLDDGSALQVTVAQALTGKTRKPLDGVGVTPNVTVSENGLTFPGLSHGADPQMDRAVTLLQKEAAKQPTLPLRPLPHPSLQPPQIMQTLTPVLANVSVIPAGPNRQLMGSQVIDTPNEFVSGAASVDQLRATVIKRGWQGTVQEYFGSHDPPTYAIEYDIYKNAAGAQAAAVTNDYPNQLQVLPSPISFGANTQAIKGINSSVGTAAIGWRRGRVTMSVQYFGAPGKEPYGQIATIAKGVDALYMQHPIK